MGREIDSIRTRAELARRLSTQINEPKSAKALREIADALDAEADMLESNVSPLREMSPPRQE
jgi:hypothetical protein